MKPARRRRARVSGDPTLEAFPLPPGSGYSYAPGFTSQHRGVDILAPLGTPVRAVRDGNARSAIEPKGGRVVYLDAGDGTRFFYGHLDSWTLEVMRPEGARVLAGDVIGTVGNSGNAIDRPTHLHFQIRDGSLVVDPLPYLVAVDPAPNKPRVPAPSSPFDFFSGFGAGAGSTVALLLLVWAASKAR